MHQRFRRDRQHDHRGDRQRAERHGAAVDHDGDQHHRRHEERALRRDFGARQQQIERAASSAAAADHFLIGKPTVSAGDQRQQRAHRKEHHAGDHGHVIAGDRQHVAEAGDEHRIVDRRRDRVAAAGQQRGRDRALVAVERGADARVDRVAQALHERGVAQRQPPLNGGSTVLIAPITKPEAPMPWKYMSRPKS
jgi:hypothetical protein